MVEMTRGQCPQDVQRPDERSTTGEQRPTTPFSRGVILSLAVFVLSFAALFAGPALALRLMAGPAEGGGPSEGPGGRFPGVRLAATSALTEVVLQQGKSPSINGNPVGPAYTGTQDTYINRWIPDTNFGNESRLMLGQSRAYRPLVRFDLTPGSIPPASTVVTAQLGLYCYARNVFNALTAQVYQVVRPWNPTQATWMNATAADQWSIEGCDHPSTDRWATPVLTRSVFDRLVFQYFDVTSIVQNWVTDPSSNKGLLLVGPDPVVIYYYYSSRASNSGYRPKLIINWGYPTPTPTPTATPGPSPTPTTTPPALPVVIDNTALCYTHTPAYGFWQPGTTGGYGSNYWYETSSALTGTARWAPCAALPLPVDGMYDVQAHWSVHSARPVAVPYLIQYDGGSATVNVDQTKDAGGNTVADFSPSGWHSLGVYPFLNGALSTTQYVELNTSSTGDTCADAVRWVPSLSLAGPPYTVSMAAYPPTLPSDGVATTTLMITVTDRFGRMVNDGTMVGLTTDLGTIAYTYTEAESADVTKLGGWADAPDASASGGHYIFSVATGDEISWGFHGPAVSLVYLTNAGGGMANVSVDGSFVTTISFASSALTYKVERLLTSGLSSGVHTLRITNIGVGPIWLDALRSGLRTSGGVATTSLIAPSTIGTANLRAVAIQPDVSRLTTAWPFTQTTVAFPGPSEVWVDDDYCAACANGGHHWNFDAFKTIQAAVDKALSGGTVHVAAGVYTESVTITRPLSLLGSGGRSTTVLNGVNDAPGSRGIYVDLADDVTISGFRIKNFETGVYLHGTGADHINRASVLDNYFESNGVNSSAYAVRGNRVYNSTICSNDITLGWNGVYLEHAYLTTVCYNQIYDNQGFGITLDTGDDNSLDNNTMYENQNVGIELTGATLRNGVYGNVMHDLWWDGVLVNGGGAASATVAGNVITATNLVWLNASGAVPDASHNWGGIVVRGVSADSAVYDNRVSGVSNAQGHRADGAGILLDNNSGQVSVDTNLVQGCLGHGIRITATGYPGGSPLSMHGNSIYANRGFGIYNQCVAAVAVAEGNWWGRNAPTTSVNPADLGFDVYTGFGANVGYAPVISLTLSAAPTSIPANGTATSTITATASGGGYYILDGTLITFTSDLSTLVYPAASVFGAGRSNAILRAGTLAGVATITGTAEPGVEGQTTTVTLTALDPNSISLMAEPNSVMVDVYKQALVTATVRDIYGNPVPGRTVAFACNVLGAVAPGSGATDALGEAGTKFTAATTTPGTGVVTATVGGVLSTSISIPITAGPVCTSSMTIAASPATIVGNGVSTSTITVNMTDCFGNRVVDGTMVRFNTTLGTIVDYQYVEAEDAAVSKSPEWSTLPDATASSGFYISTATPGAAAFWDFRGGAVALTYWRSGGGGVMQVRIDGGAPFLMYTTGAPAAWTERVMASGLDPAVTHRIEITYVSGLIELDVFRSGASSVGGRATAILRSSVLNVTNTATVYATERMGDLLWPPLTVNTAVTFSPANVVWVDDDYCPLCSNDGHVWGNDAFSNIPAGVTAVRRPGTVMVLTGTYTLPVDITIGNVNLLGAGAPGVIVDGAGLPNPAMAIWGVNNVVIRDFTFANWGSGVNIPGPASNLEVSNSVFTNCMTLGISGVRVNSSLFANNTIQHSDGGGIELDTLSGVTLRDNRIHDISGTGIHVFSSVAVPCIGNEISYNTIERLGASGISAGAFCSNTLVLSNTVRSTNRTATGGGIVLDSTTDSRVEHNIVTEVSNAGASTDTAGIRIDGTNAGGEIHFNRVLANVNDGVACLSYNTPPTVTCNHIYANGHYGLVNNFGTVVDARGNWWGTNSPTGGPPAPADIGFIVPGNVNWFPAMQLTLTAEAASVPAGGAPIVITAVAGGGGCAMLESMPITFTTNLGGLGAPPTTTVLMAMSGGEASTLFTPGTHAGIATITATVPNGGVATVTVEVKPGLPASIDLIATPTAIVVGTGPASQSALSAYVWDMYGNPVVNGTQVSFTTSLGSITPTMNTTAGGLAASTLYAGTVPGIASVSARWDGSFVVDSTDVEITAGPPFVISSLTADPSAILSNGLDTSQITAVVRDEYGNYVPDGTMVAFYTTAGSLIYGTVEAESGSVVHTGWATVADGTASGGAYIQTSTVGAEARWDFHGEAVSVGYRMFAAGGVMDVVVDGIPVKTINTSGAPAAWTEAMLANGLDPTALHRVEIFCTSGTLRLDFLRSGATTTSGHAVAVLTSGTTPTTAHVYATGIGGTFPVAVVDVQFLEPLDVWVDDNWTPSSSGGHLWGFDAFSNIPAAVARVRSGGNVHVADGVYTQTIDIAKPLHLDGAGSSSTTHLVGPGTGDGIHVFWPADGTTIEGFAIMSFTHGINLTGHAADYLQGVTVTNVVIERCGAPGVGGAITATYVNNGYFADNALHNDNGYGFDLDTGNNNILRNNHIYDNSGFGVRIMSGALASDNNQVLENNIYDLRWEGIRVGLNSTNSRVMTNTVHNTNFATGGGFDMGGIALYGTINTRVEDNTIYDVQNGGGALADTAGVALSLFNSGALIQNNRILSNRNHGIWIRNDGYPGASVPQIHGNSIYGNLGFGILNNVIPATGVANAEGNWWGRNTPTVGVVGPRDIFNGWGANVDYTPQIRLDLTRSPTQIVADGVSTAVITATMKTTAPDYHVLNGTLVTFTTNLGSLGAPFVVRAMANGVANVILQSDTVSGRSYITATTPSAGLDTTWVDLVAGPPANIEITASPAAVWAWDCTPAGYPRTSTINVTVTDQYGNPCEGQNITYTLSSGLGAALSWTTGILDVLGAHFTTFASGNIAGTALVTVTAGSISRAVPVQVMSGPPTDVSVARSPEAIAADGVSTSTISATVRDNCGSAGVGNLVYDGTMVGFVTRHGTLPYGYAEAESALPSVHISAPSDWATVASGSASGGAYLRTTHSGAWVSWQFTGTAVSFIYTRYSAGGQVRVYVDDVLRKTLSTFTGGPDEWQRETVIANALAFGPHTLKVEASTLAPGIGIAVDAFRSGATTMNGVATAILTSEPLSCTAYITATAVDSRLEALSGLPYGATTVRFERANLAIQKTASATSLPSGMTVDFTLTYTNTGLAQATNALITDTLPVSLTYVSTTSSPFIGLPTNPITNVWVWSLGDVLAGGVGTVTMTARRLCQPGLGVVTNTVDIGSLTIETPPGGALNNNHSWVTMTLAHAEPFTVTLRSVPPAVQTDSHSTLHITVTDACGDAVPGATVYLTTNVGAFISYPGVTHTTRIVDAVGHASVSYWGGPSCGLATINATSGAAQGVLYISIGAGQMAHSVVMADPPAIPADGLSASAISAQILDTGMCIVPDGTFVGFTTTAGSTVYGYAEDDSPQVHQSPPGSWDPWSDSQASGGRYIFTSLDGAAVYWNMVGNGVSLVYLQVPGAGVADVDLDGVPLGEINMHSITTTVYLAEKVYTWPGSPTENHVVSVRRRPGSAGPVNVDALRSGRTTLGGMAVALLTSTTTPMTATVYATAISETLGIPIRIPGHVNVAFGATDLGISKTVQPAVQVTIGQKITYTLTYRNYGPVTATSTYVDDVLSVDALRDLFFSETPFTATNYVHYYWPLGNVPPGVSRTITFGGTIDTSHYWPSATALVNTAVVGSNTLDPVSANNTDVVTTTIVPGRPASLSLWPSPGSIPVGGSISTLTASVRDSYGNPVPNGTPVTFTTTLGGFPASSEFVGTTSGGAAVASLASSNNVGTANILAAVDGLTATTQVVFYPLPPFTMTLMATPPQIFVGGSSSIIDAWIVDQYGNWVANGTAVQFATSAGTIQPSSVGTSNGRAAAVLTSGNTALTATVTVTALPVSRTVQVVFLPGTPRVTMTARPATLRVGETSMITLTARDEFNNPLVGEPVTFTTDLGDFGSGYMTVTVGTDLTGRAWVGLRSTLVGQALVRGRIRTESGAVVVTFGPGDPYAITLRVDPGTIVGCGGTALARAEVKDRYGNHVRDGTVVVFDVAPQGEVRPIDGGRTTDGWASAWVVSGAVPGPATVWAWPENWRSQVVAQFPMDFLVGPADRVELTAVPSPLPVGHERGVIKLHAVDCGGYPVANGTPVTFTITTGEGSLSPQFTTTTNGWAYSDLTSPDEAGSASIRASIDGREATVVVVYDPGPVYNVEVDAVPALIAANGVSTATITAKLRDRWGNYVADRTELIFTTDLGSFSGSQSFRTSTRGGLAAAVLTAGLTPGRGHVAATANNGRRGETYIDLFSAPTPTPTLTPTPRSKIALPIIMKYRYR